jgi:hypothetical protein
MARPHTYICVYMTGRDQRAGGGAEEAGRALQRRPQGGWACFLWLLTYSLCLDFVQFWLISVSPHSISDPDQTQTTKHKTERPPLHGQAGRGGVGGGGPPRAGGGGLQLQVRTH